MKMISSNSANALVDYVGAVEVASDVDRIERDRANGRTRMMFASAQHCRVETAKAEFKALRVEHGRQGETRTVPATYVAADLLEDGFEPTHLKVGKNWRAAKANERATHFRVEPTVPLEKRAEAYHYIISFAPDTVNIDDPEQCQRAFEAVEAMMEQDYAGVQAVMVGQGDAKGSRDAIARDEGGKFHVHVAANAVIHSQMEAEGRNFMPGQRLSGPLTHVDTFRQRWDTFLDTRGHEFGLDGQNRDILPEVGSAEYRNKARRSDHDFWENERGEISDHGKARRGLEAAFANLADDPAAMASLSTTDRLQRLASEVATTGDVDLKLRSTNSGEKIRSFVVPGRKQAIGATKLGGRYTNDGVQEQLELIAKGQWQPIERNRSGPAQPAPELSDSEVAALQRTADQLAAQEVRDQALDAWLADRAAAAGLSVEQQWAVRGMTGSPADRAMAEGWKSEWDTEQFRTLLREAEAAAISGQRLSGETVEPNPLPDSTRDTEQHRPAVEPEVEQAAEFEGDPAEQFEKLLQQTEAEVSGETAVPSTPSATPRRTRRRDVDEVKENDVQAASPVALEQQGQGSTPQPAAPNVEDTTSQPQSAAQSQMQPGMRAKRRPRYVGRLTPRQMQDRELVAVVMREREGGAYVSFELAADDPVAAGRDGLFLHAKESVRTDKHNNQRKVTNTWQQLSRSDYANLQQAAGENITTSDGKQVMAIRGDIVPWGEGGVGYNADVHSLSPSRRNGLSDDVLARQQQSEDRSRLSAAKQRLDGRVSQITGADAPGTSHEAAFERARDQQNRSRSLDGPDL